jgi:hypothetical protein
MMHQDREIMIHWRIKLRIKLLYVSLVMIRERDQKLWVKMIYKSQDQVIMTSIHRLEKMPNHLLLEVKEEMNKGMIVLGQGSINQLKLKIKIELYHTKWEIVRGLI